MQLGVRMYYKLRNLGNTFELYRVKEEEDKKIEMIKSGSFEECMDEYTALEGTLAECIEAQ